ncbi:MAG TPA: hypothetical protein VGN11_02385 [Candidatus Baltobacteraceae bacterium]|jgi:hypothetical protein|nr:hypothetical protein [Candidatus Baltobacteraceae bacterium]
MNTEQQVQRRYFIELFGSLFAYMVVLIGVNLIADRTGSSNRVLMVGLSILPMIPIAFALAAIVRFLNRCDELERSIQLTSLAVAFGATAFASFSYGFLEGAGFPRLSMFNVWPFMAAVWLVTSFILRMRYR